MSYAYATLQFTFPSTCAFELSTKVRRVHLQVLCSAAETSDGDLEDSDMSRYLSSLLPLKNYVLKLKKLQENERKDPNSELFQFCLCLIFFFLSSVNRQLAGQNFILVERYGNGFSKRYFA